MERVTAKNTSKKINKQRKPPKTSLSLEDQLKIFANLIVERIVEEQKNGTLPITINK